jgi:hypothetical protein
MVMLMADTNVEIPEFHIVVRRPGRGPLAPYRFAIVILFIMAISGRQLIEAAQTGVNTDAVLIRSAIAGALAWFVLGRVNSILKAAAPPRVPTRTSGDDAVIDVP